MWCGGSKAPKHPKRARGKGMTLEGVSSLHVIQIGHPLSPTSPSTAPCLHHLPPPPPRTGKARASLGKAKANGIRGMRGMKNKSVSITTPLRGIEGRDER